MPAPVITVRIAFASNPFDSAPVWEDVSSYAISYNTKRGRRHELDRMESGTATITLLNTSDNFWSNNTGGAYSPNVLPGKRINIQATYGGTTYDRFTGFIESWEPSFILDPMLGPVTTLTCSDLFENLSHLALNNAGYAQELSGTRFGNVLDSLAWPAGSRTLDAGQSLMKATGALVNENALDHLFNVATSERGIFFTATDGKVVFQDRHARFKSPYTTSQAIFANPPGGGEFGYSNIELAFDKQYIYNDIRFTRSGGAEQVSTDSSSITANGKRSLMRGNLLVTTDAEVLSQTQYLLSQYKSPSLRAKSITIKNGDNPCSLYPITLGKDLSSRITIKMTQASLNKDYHIEGITEAWNTSDPVLRYIVTQYQLSNADSVVYWALGVAGLSELGETTILSY